MERSEPIQADTVIDVSDRLLAFAHRYFGHYCEHPPSRFHLELAAELERILASKDSERFACAAPRGMAKTTWVSLIFIVFCIVNDLKRFIVLITNTSALAKSLLLEIKHELETNELLAADFPTACGVGSVWRTTEIVTQNGVKLLAIGAGQRIRGRKHHQHRPDLFILDDLENDDQVRNVEQRDKVFDWLSKAVLKAKGLAKKADVVMVGTILHFDSVLARLLDPQRSPGWRGRKYRAVIRWADRQDLWQRWQEMYTDWRKPDTDRLAAASLFFEQHRESMLAGTEVLWPEAEPYYDLMKLRVDEGTIAFDSEKQNEPIDPASCEFREEWFEWFNQEEIDGQTWLVPERGDRIRLTDCDNFGAADPSMGKLDKHRDPSAIVTIAAYPSRRIDPTGTYRFFFCLDADTRRRHPHKIMQDIFSLHRLRGYERFGIEAIQFQELFAEQVQEAAFRDRLLQDLRIVKLKPLSDKKLRIQKLSSFVYSGRLRFYRKLTDLYNQLRYFPHAQHDDGPDALELCMETMGQIGLRPVAPSMPPTPPRSADPLMQQLRDGLPHIFDTISRSTCGDCAFFRKGEEQDPNCHFLRVNVAADTIACPSYTFDLTRRGSR